MKRYQLYLDPHTVGIIDEAAEIGTLNRSEIIRQVVDAAAARLGNLLAVLRPPEERSYEWMDSVIGAVKKEETGEVNLSQNVDDIYYQ